MRSDSNCWMEVLHSDRHLDRSIISVSRSAGTILHCLRLALSVSLYLFLWPPRARAPSFSSLYRRLSLAVCRCSFVSRDQSSETELQSGVPRCRICYRCGAPRCWAACLAIERVQTAVGSAYETALTFAHDDGTIPMFLTQTAVRLI